jgi:acetoin utilization protein AcuB
MRLAEIMSSPVETIQAGESADTAWDRMQSKKIHHLVVLKQGQTVGVISARDLSGPRGVALRWAGTVDELMSSKVVTATPETTVREAANLLRGRNIGCLPIVDGRKVVGIVTITDLIELVGRGLEKPVAAAPRRALPRAGMRRKSSGRPTTAR